MGGVSGVAVTFLVRLTLLIAYISRFVKIFFILLVVKVKECEGARKVLLSEGLIVWKSDSPKFTYQV